VAGEICNVCEDDGRRCVDLDVDPICGHGSSVLGVDCSVVQLQRKDWPRCSAFAKEEIELLRYDPVEGSLMRVSGLHAQHIH